MEWPEIRQRLSTAAKTLKANKVMDVAISEILKQIPVVGGFAEGCWSKLGGDDEARSAQLAQFLEQLSQQRALFEATQNLIRQQGQEQMDALLRSQRSLELILVLVEGVGGGIKQVAGDVAEVKDDIKLLALQTAKIEQAVGKPFVGDAFKVSASLIDDHKRRQEMIAAITQTLEADGQKVSGDTLYDLSILFMATNRGELAEAALLELHHRDEARTDALAALGQLYQRRAHEYILQKNYGFAEDLLDKARAYAKAADDDMDSLTDLRLAYIYKELAQAYMASGQAGQAKKPLTAARKLFGGVLAVDKSNASAWNGLGSLAIVQGNYAEAVTHIAKAVEAHPNYVEAWYDLAQSYYGLSRQAKTEKEALGLQVKGLEAYLKVKELALKEIYLPPAAEQHLDKIYQPLVDYIKAQQGA